MNKKLPFLAAAFGLCCLCCHTLSAQPVQPPPLPVPFHWQTNIVAVPCQFFYYYGESASGRLTCLGRVDDHNLEQFERGLRDSPLPEFQHIFRTDNDIGDFHGWSKITHVWDRSAPAPAPPPLPVRHVAATVTDTNPPAIESFTVREAVPADFPQAIPFAWLCLGLTNIQATFQIHSNWYYAAWSTSNLLDWEQFETSASLHPSRTEGSNVVKFPVKKEGQDFFQVRANPSVGITYP